MIVHGPTYMGWRQAIRGVCVWVTGASLLANLLPHDERFQRWPRAHKAYSIAIDLVAFVACNFRVCLPSLQQEFMGFRRTMGRRVHAWTEEPR